MLIHPVSISIGYKTYIIFAVINAAFVPIVYFFYPEVSATADALANDNPLTISCTQTKGLALEDVDRLFAKHGGDAERRLSAIANDHHGVEAANGGDVEKPVKYAT